MKLDHLRDNWRLWLPGLLIALLGVALARIAAPLATGQTQTVLVSVGRLIAFAGLFVIAFAIKRRSKNSDH